MSNRTPLRERPSKIKKHLPIVYSIEGIEDNPIIKEVEKFEKTLYRLDGHKLMDALGISPEMSQEDIKKRIYVAFDNISAGKDEPNGDGVDE